MQCIGRLIASSLAALALTACGTLDQSVQRRSVTFNEDASAYQRQAVLLNILRAREDRPLIVLQLSQLLGHGTVSGSLGLPSITFGPDQLTSYNPATKTYIPRSFTLGPNNFGASFGTDTTMNPVSDASSYAALLSPANITTLGLLQSSLRGGSEFNNAYAKASDVADIPEPTESAKRQPILNALMIDNLQVLHIQASPTKPADTPGAAPWQQDEFGKFYSRLEYAPPAYLRQFLDSLVVHLPPANIGAMAKPGESSYEICFRFSHPPPDEDASKAKVESTALPIQQAIVCETSKEIESDLYSAPIKLPLTKAWAAPNDAKELRLCIRDELVYFTLDSDPENQCGQDRKPAGGAAILSVTVKQAPAAGGSADGKDSQIIAERDVPTSGPAAGSDAAQGSFYWTIAVVEGQHQTAAPSDGTVSIYIYRFRLRSTFALYRYVANTMKEVGGPRTAGAGEVQNVFQIEKGERKSCSTYVPYEGEGWCVGKDDKYSNWMINLLVQLTALNSAQNQTPPTTSSTRLVQ